MRWIKDFAKGSYSLFAGQTLSGFQPIDFYHFFPLYYDLWVADVVRAIKKLDLENKSYQEIKDILPLPSSMRAIIIKMIPSYKALRKNQEDFATITNFLARMLQEACPSDPFALKSSPTHSPEEVREILNNKEWTKADVVTARKIGQLVTVAGSLIHGLYNDVVTDLGWEAHGPYNLENNKSLLIRHFPNLSPVELNWPNDFLLSKKDVKIYSTFQDVEWEIAAVGCHTIVTKGSPVQGMTQFSVEADSKVLSIEEIDQLIEEMGLKAEKIYRNIRQKNFEELKLMVIRQESYQFKKLFDAAGIDWEPTEVMLGRIRNKELVPVYLPQDAMMSSLEEYKNLFGINLFGEEVVK